MYFKIVIKNNFESKEDIVCRPLIRSFKRVKNNPLLSGENAFIYGYSDGDGVYELLTGLPIEYQDSYELVDNSQMLEVWSHIFKISEEEINQLRLYISKYIFQNDVKLDYDVFAEEMKDRSFDRFLQFEAYDKGLSLINPFSKNHLVNYNHVKIKK